MALSTIGTNAITDATIVTGDIADSAITSDFAKAIKAVKDANSKG